MHDIEFPQDYLDRIVKRRSRLHVFDMQNAFVAEGAPTNTH